MTEPAGGLQALHQARGTVHAKPPGDRPAFRGLTLAGLQVGGWQTVPREGARFARWAALPAAGDHVVEIRAHNNASRSVVPCAFGLALQ